MNKSSSHYLGTHIAEQVLSKVFKDVVRMPPNNPGYDFEMYRIDKVDDVMKCCERIGFNNQ